jgi:TusE/DsrC/DsvC family sulfur relay protein
METLTYNGTQIEVNTEGYLKDMNQWTPELARTMASQEGIDLTEKHFDVLNWLRTKQAEGTALSIRKIGNSGLVDIKQFLCTVFPEAH